MKRNLAMIVAVSCLLWPRALIAQKSDLQQLQEAYEDLSQARNSLDAEKLAAAVDDRAMFFEASGELTSDVEAEGKSAFREGLRKAFEELESFQGKATNAKYRVIGSTGVVWADFDVETIQKGGRRSGAKGRSVHVFTKSGDRWLVVAAFRYPRE